MHDLARIADTLTDPDTAAAIHRGYLRWFDRGSDVLDVGCGRGGLLTMLTKEGRNGIGVDSSAEAIAACRAAGHHVIEGDALGTMRAFCDEARSFDGVVIAQLVEHMEPHEALAVIAAAARILRPHGKLLVATPNPKNLIVLTETFWLDPTHVRPYPRRLLELLGAEAGLETIASYDDPASVPRRSGLRRAVARLRTLVSGADKSGPMESVVVLSKPG